VQSYDSSSNKKAGAGGYIAQIVRAMEPHNEGGVDAEDDSTYPKVGESVNDSKRVIPHG